MASNNDGTAEPPPPPCVPAGRGSTRRPRAKILLLGDSITQLSFSAVDAGWGAHLADVYQRRADVLNRGKSGYNTDWYLRYLRTSDGFADVFGYYRDGDDDENDEDGGGRAKKGEEENVRLATIFFGANDSSCSELNARQHVPLDRYRSNLKEIAGMVRTAVGDRAKIVIVGPPPVHHESRLEFQIKKFGKDGATGKLERNLDLSGKYAAAAEEVAADVGAPFLNLWKDMQEAKPSSGDGDEPWKAFLSDGLHLSREGNLFVGKGLVELIQREFPDLAVAPCPHTGSMGNSGSRCPDLEHLGPWHDRIDHTDAAKAFGGRKRKRGESENGKAESG